MNDRDLTPGESAVLLLDEAESLIWALLDDQIEDAETTKLTKLLNENEDVRRRYLECIQLHVDLQTHFSAVDVSGAKRAKTAVLPNLMSGGVASSEVRVVD